MSHPLGKGLESLIPDKPEESILDTIELDTPKELDASKVEVASAIADLKAPLTADITSQSISPPSEPASFLSKDNSSRRSESIFWIEIDKIESNPFQPRREFNETALGDLANSIREHGVLQPILVAKREIETARGIDIKYQLIAGERRVRAARLAGLTRIPAIIRRGMPDDRIKLELALIENVQREDLNAMERARAFKKLLDEFGLTQRDIANRIGKSRVLVTNTLRLLFLPQEVQMSVLAGDLTEGHARAVLMAGDDPAKQKEVFDAILLERLNVREAENRARQVSGRALLPHLRTHQDPETKEWQKRLQEKFGTKVVLHRRGERGRIVVEFYSDEELRGILNKMITESY